MSKITLEIYKHRPMFVRRFIALLALAAAYGVMHFSDDVMLTVAAYFVAVTLLDFFVFYALRIKSSDYANAEQLMVDDQTTFEGLDQYAGDRRKIRMVSLVLSSLTSGVAYLVAPAFVLHVFCLSFLASTIVGLAILKPHYRKKFPVIIKRDDRYYRPSSGPRAGYVSPAMYAAGQLSGYTYGPIDV